jgi:hypothetical protein
MSLPGLVAQPLTSMLGQVAVATISPFEAIIGSFNGNLYFIGIMMLILNLGGRFLAMEITKDQELFFQNPWVRRFLIFVVLFVATRNILVAFWLTVIVVIVLGFLFNENSALSIFGKPKGMEGVPVQTMTPEEVEIFRRLNEKRMRNEQASQGSEDADKKKKKDADPWMVYMAKMSLLGN